MISILNIGCRYYNSDPNRTGGVVVLFEQWLNFCSSLPEKYRFETIDSNKKNYKNKIIALFSITHSILKFSRKRIAPKIIFLHATYFDIMVLSPILIFCKRIFKVKVVMRKFGGNFDELYHQSNWIIKRYIRLVLASFDVCFWESKRLVKFGKLFNNQSYWFPNVRVISDNKRDFKRPFEHKLVFISRVEREKGILDLIKAVTYLGYPYTLDIFGPVYGIDLNELKAPNVSYKGVLSPMQITDTLSQYDILCLPTYWKGEGYPGIIIEAFSVGLPVISTYKGGIPELIDHKRNGLLIQPNDSKSLISSIQWFNEENFKLMAKHSLESFSLFDANNVNDRIMSIIHDI